MRKRKRNDTTYQEPRIPYSQTLLSIVSDVVFGIQDLAKLIWTYEGLLAPIVADSNFNQPIESLNSPHASERAKAIEWMHGRYYFPSCVGVAERVALLIDQGCQETIAFVLTAPHLTFPEKWLTPKATRIIPILTTFVGNYLFERVLWKLVSKGKSKAYQEAMDCNTPSVLIRYYTKERPNPPRLSSWAMRLLLYFNKKRKDPTFCETVLELLLSHVGPHSILTESPWYYMYPLFKQNRAFVDKFKEPRILKSLVEHLHQHPWFDSLRMLYEIAIFYPTSVTQFPQLVGFLEKCSLDPVLKDLSHQLSVLLMPYWAIEFV